MFWLWCCCMFTLFFRIMGFDINVVSCTLDDSSHESCVCLNL